MKNEWNSGSLRYVHKLLRHKGADQSVKQTGKLSLCGLEVGIGARAYTNTLDQS